MQDVVAMTDLKFHAEGSEPDLIARAWPHELDFWSIHPDVLHVHAREFEGAAPGQVELLFWLSEPPADWEAGPSPYADAPSRPADIDVWGGGKAPGAFIDRLEPLVEHLICIEDFDDSEEFGGLGSWAMKIWIKR